MELVARALHDLHRDADQFAAIGTVLQVHPSGLKLFSLLYLGMSSDSPYQELADAFGRLIKFIGIGYLITIVCNMIVVKRYPPHEGTVTFGAIWLVMMTPLVVVIGSVQLYALLH
ncbi:hypothetical protein IPG36_06255 [bacterium]|nr:MAG: hypothetical protein IPG36_06255 [bacterium]